MRLRMRSMSMRRPQANANPEMAASLRPALGRHAVGSDECGADGTNLRTGESAHWLQSLGTKKYLPASSFATGTLLCRRRARCFGVGHVDVGDVVALNPGAEVAVGDIVFRLAGARAVAAADALGDVDEHAPPVVGHFVVGRGLGAPGQHGFPGNGGGGHKDEKVAAVEVHFALPVVEVLMAGL
jgi:hypothetical protein